MRTSTPLLALTFALLMGTQTANAQPADMLRDARKGDAAAQTALGTVYVKGEVVAANPHEAAKWYRKAAEQGYAQAQYNLGVLYDDGMGVEQDKAEAARWFRRAAEQGYVRGQYNLGLMLANGLGVPIPYIDETNQAYGERVAFAIFTLLKEI